MLATLKAHSAEVTAAAGKARTFTACALLSARGLRPGGAYRLLLTATSPAGRASTLVIRFVVRGAAGAATA